MPKRKRSAKTKGADLAVDAVEDKKSDTSCTSTVTATATAAATEGPWSKSKKKRMRRLMAREKKKKSLHEANDNNESSNGNENGNNVGIVAGVVAGNIDHTQKSNQIQTTTNSEQEQQQQEEEEEQQQQQQSSQFNNKPTTKFSALQQKFLSRLAGSRFRELNEELYTTTSTSALERFQQNPTLFEQYHEGFRTQVKSWPTNPVDVIYKWIISYYHQSWKVAEEANGNDNGNALEHRKLRIADFGCGDAKLGEKLLAFRPNSNTNSKKKKKKKKESGKGSNTNTKCPFKVHSFDLVANGNKLITPCDMSDVPLKNNSIDIGVFVLALMGTNIADFIREAHRVLTPSGVLKIAEVRSRFESTIILDDGHANAGFNMSATTKKQQNKNNKKQQQPYVAKKQVDDTILNNFLDVMEELGFQCIKRDRQNKMFIVLEFNKTGKRPSKHASFTAKPCIYKRR